jgi:hypothetical protein
MEGYMYCEWKVNKVWYKGFVKYDRIGEDIPFHTIRSLNGPHYQEQVNEFISKWGWKKLEHRV